MQANKEDKLSKAIKNKLEGYERKPSPHVWEHIAANINASSSSNEGAAILFLRKNWHLVAVIAAAILLLLFVLSFAGDTGMIQQSPLNQHQQISENHAESSPEKPAPKASPQHQQTEVTRKVEAISDVEHQELPSDASGINRPLPQHNITTLATLRNRQLITASTALAAAPETKVSLPVITQPLSSSAAEDKMNKQNRELINPQPPISNNWAFGFYATPERLYTQANTSGNSPSFSADLAVMYHIDNYFIQSGVSLGSSDDNSNANINFLQTEFLGTYQDVYDVTFDTTGSEPRPIYHTQKVDVFDTTERNTTTLYTNSYRYLSMPLLLGYKQNISGRFSYSLKGGPVVSLMMNESESYSFDKQNAEIQAIYNRPAGRVTTNWQMLVSAGLHYKLHNHIWFAVEPRVKYYFNPVYNTQSGFENQNPFAIGLRTGLTIGF